MDTNSSERTTATGPVIRVSNKIENLTADIDVVLRAMFGQFSQVVIEAEFGRGYSGSRAFRIRLVDKIGKVHLPAVIKIVDQRLINKEAAAYHTWVQGTLPNIARLEAPPTLPVGSKLGGLHYALVGSGTFEIQSLRDYYQHHHIDDVCWILENRLFAILGQNWWLYNRANRLFQMQADYDIFLPVNLEVKWIPGPEDRMIYAFEPGNMPPKSPAVGDQVWLKGFVVDKVNLRSQEVTLNLPPTGLGEPARSYRIRLEGGEDFGRYQRDQVVEEIYGLVTNTRQNLLYAYAAEAMGAGVDLTAERLSLPAGLSLPNPLWTYENVLADFMSVRISTVHGDLNMENILIDPATRDVSLIDFATVRQGHALHDLLRLETEVIIMLIPPVLASQNLRPEVIYDFYRQLHEITLAHGWDLPAHCPQPDLEKPLKLILTIRKMAHNCLYDHHDWGEYYRGLILYLLGALKLKGLNDLPTGLLPKQLAFWAAAALQSLLEMSRLRREAPARPEASLAVVPIKTPPLEIENPYGTMPPDSQFYIERTADRHGWRELSNLNAATVFVQAPRQMGKSSLLKRMAYWTQTELNRATAFIDFQKIPGKYFSREEEFYTEFCSMIGDELDIPEEIERHWRGPRSVLIKCSRYLSDYLLPQVKTSVVLVLDEVEQMVDSPFRSDFFGMLRTWHNDRATDPNFARLTLLLSSSTEPYLLIDNPYQSPFNVAVPLTLYDFTLAEVAELNERHGSPLTPAGVADLVDLLGGHPFLTRLALYEITLGKWTLAQVLAEATTEAGPFSNHLRYYMQRISQRPELDEALRQILREQSYQENAILHRLESAGLITRRGRQISLRNKLYTRYFQERFYG